ncbi:MAG TPA: hypothetical protein VLI93_09290, partial [Acetobacteraceae bacterium]|nr:hypothetical protein [Acetobacteraceae bacterium]
ETERLKSHPTFSFGDIQAMIPGLTFGAGFVLHVRNGAIEFLEGYSYEEPWPESVSGFVLRADEGLSDIKADTLREITKKMHSAATA